MSPVLNKNAIFTVFFALLVYSKLNSPFLEFPIIIILIDLWDYIDGRFHISETFSIAVLFVLQYTLKTYTRLLFGTFWSPQKPLDRLIERFFYEPLRDYPTLDIILRSAPSVLPLSERYQFERSFYRTLLALPLTRYPTLDLSSILAYISPGYYGVFRDYVERGTLIENCLALGRAFNAFRLYARLTPFYITQLDYQKLTTLSSLKESFNIYHPLKLQSLLSNTIRWSYKYNMLHRRIIHNSHKLTNVKRLLSLGYFDFGIVDSNLWFSDQYGRDLSHPKVSKGLSSKSILQKSWELLYRSNFNKTGYTSQILTGQPFLTPSNPFKNLSFYESSFHFFLKRVKLFLTLGSQPIKSRSVHGGNGVGLSSTGGAKLIYPLLSLTSAQNSL
jgi:hypothetical protein